eukprot:TRINITY_DN5495_c0_g1_i3.p1 TRINITY_DN5495_c0_g1~~TRINITY_DN5495_c0_g1_i3.p1  ORF type:complete len:575 (+),score=208.91 TRINITY_DN5495_c0_g1_i3:50-1774(+)
MDVNELLNFKPKMAPKRPLGSVEDEYEDNPDENYEMRAAKRLKAKNAAAKRRLEEERMALLEAEVQHQQEMRPPEAKDEDSTQELDENDGQDELNESRLKKLVLAFEKKTLKNQEIRIKHPDVPEKFMESEVELHDAIQDLRIISTAPELYPALVDLRIIPSTLGLLSHENSDISVAVIDLLQELTDIDTLTESRQGADALIATLCANQIAPLLVQNLERLSPLTEEDNNDGIHNTLSIIENLVEFRPEMSREIAEAGILLWLSKRLKARIEFDANKLYASEILSILLQNEERNRVSFGEIQGAMDSMLQQLAYYKRHEPNSVEENEMLENVFDCLCSLLLHGPNRELFLKGEGLQLMNLMLREKKSSRNGALKVLSHALGGLEGRDCCNKLVDVLGLRTVFPLFMKTPKRSKRKGVSADEHEERTVSILSSLLRNVRSGSQRSRLLSKFSENDYEKVDRLLELHFKYLNKVDATERLISRRVEEDLDEDEIYLQRLEGGLFTLQLVDYITMEICCNGGSSTPNIKARVHQILNQRNANIKTLRNIVREYAGNLGQEGEGESDKQHLLQLVDKF